MQITEDEAKDRARLVQLDIMRIANAYFQLNPMQVGDMMIWIEKKVFELCEQRGLDAKHSVRTKHSVDVYVDYGHKIAVAFLPG